MTTPKDALELKPCPFCGGEAESDSTRGYRNISTGNPEKSAAIYCTRCSADMTWCYRDTPEIERDQVMTLLIEQWNTRATASLEGDAVERVALAFHSGEQVPDVERGSMQCCIVVTENEQGKHFAFPGYYLNAYPLQYDECRCDEPCEDGCPTTGWFYDESNWEYENCYYPISSKILRWALIPDATTILATGLVPDEAAIRADEREKALTSAMDVVENLRVKSATTFNDPRHSGQRGMDRCDALYDAYHALAAIRSNGRGA